MKKIFALILAVMMLALVIAGCSNGGNNVTTTTQSPKTDVTTTSPSGQTSQTTTASASTTTTSGSTTTSASTAPATTAPAVDPVKKDPIAHITFDELTDSFEFIDDTGNGHNAVASEKLKIVEGRFGNAVYLESEGQHITISDSEDFKFSKNDSFTIEIWFKWSGTLAGGNWPCVIQKGLVQKENKFNYVGFWINYSDKKLNLGTTSSTSSNFCNTPASEAVGTVWHHAVAVQDAKAGTITYYLDDKYVAQLTAIDASSNGCPFTIGYNGADGQYIGAIDELNIYDYAIDMSDINIPKSVDSMLFRTYDYKSEKTGKSYSLPYRVFLPDGYDTASAEKYPVLLFLHGYGEKGNDNASQIRVLGGANLLLDKMVENGSCVVIAPQCNDPAEYNWVDINHQWATGTRQSLPENPTVTLEAATQLLLDYINEGKIDKKRVYVSGISMGGYGTWEIIARNPDLFAAAVPLCGAGILSSAESLKNMAIWAFHGSSDTTVPTSGTKDMESAIKAAGGTKIKATYYPGVGHNVWPYAYAEAGLVDWILAQSK